MGKVRSPLCGQEGNTVARFRQVVVGKVLKIHLLPHACSLLGGGQHLQVCLGLVSLACITNYGTVQLEFAARPGRFCMSSGRPGKRSKELSFFSQEEKMGLCDGWHATKGTCFLGDFGEKGFSNFGHASNILGMQN